jgi:hypothetical protein
MLAGIMSYPRFAACFACGLFFAALAPAQPPAQTPPPVVIYTEATADKLPAPKRRIRPDFPSSVRKGDAPAEITFRYIVTPQGKAIDVTVVKFSDSDMVEPGFNALEKAVFTPGEKAGKPVSVRLETTFYFPEPKPQKPVKESKPPAPPAKK